MGLFSSRSSTTTLDPMLTPEQKQAMAALTQLGTTGQYGDLNLGEAYTGSLGNYDMSQTENLAGNKLYSLLQSGSPEGFNTARNTFTNMANTTFNPDDPSSGYAAYSRQVARATGDANNVLNREAAITGNRFSTSMGQQKADLAGRQGDMLATKLGELYNTSQNRALSGAQGLVGLETANEAINQDRIRAGFDQGGLQRLLANAQAQAKLQEFTRQREEKLGQIGVLNDVFNRNVQFGQMSTTTKAPSIFSSMLGQVNPIVGSYNTAKYGAANAPNQSSLADLTKMAMAMIGGPSGAAAGAGAFTSPGNAVTVGNASGAGAMDGFNRAMKNYL